MADYRLKSIAATDHALPVIELPDSRPFGIGSGPHNYLCGTCGNGLLLNVEIKLPQNVAICCGSCQSHNLFEL